VVLTFGGRPTDCGEVRIRITQPFWRDDDERLAYERAVREIRPWAHFFAPRDFDPEDKRAPGAGLAWMGAERLCQEIVSLASGLYSRRGAVPDIPETRMSRRERDAQLAKLRGQAAEWDGKL